MQYNGTYQGSVQGAMRYNPYNIYTQDYGMQLEGQFIPSGIHHLGNYKQAAGVIASRISIRPKAMMKLYRHVSNDFKRYLQDNGIQANEIPNPNHDTLEVAGNVLSPAALSRYNCDKSFIKYVRSPLGSIPTILNIPNKGALDKFSRKDRKQYKDLLKTTINYAIYKECGQGEIYIAKRLNSLQGRSDRFIKRGKTKNSNEPLAKLQSGIQDLTKFGDNANIEFARRLKTIEMAMQIVDGNRSNSLKAAIDRLVDLPGECNCMNAICYAMKINPGYNNIENFITRNTPASAYTFSPGLRKDRSGNMRG